MQSLRISLSSKFYSKVFLNHQINIRYKSLGPPAAVEALDKTLREVHHEDIINKGLTTRKRQRSNIQEEILKTPKASEGVTQSEASEIQVVSADWKNTALPKFAFSIFDLQEFSDEEIERAFSSLVMTEQQFLIKDEVQSRVLSFLVDLNAKVYEGKASFHQVSKKSEELTSAIFQKHETLNKEEFKQSILELANRIDPSVQTLTATFLAMGTSVGLVVPILPELAHQLNFSSVEYGSIIGAFALAKMLSNVPSARLVDRFGRKKVIVSGIGILSLTNLGLGYLLHVAPSYEVMLASRIFTGVAVSFFSSAATIYLSDISTNKNRARTISPPITAFNLGASFGPAIGGLMISSFSIPLTFALAGGCFGGIWATASVKLKEPFLPEYKKRLIDHKDDEDEHPEEPFYKNKDVISIIAINGLYWYVLSGNQMTILPLVLSDPDGMNLSPDKMGLVFAAMSFVGVLGTPIAGKLIDRYKPERTIVPASMLVAAGMTVAAMETQIEYFVPAVLFWVLSGTVLGSGPTSFISERVPLRQKSKGLAWLRIAGDLGMLTGSLSAGMLADVFGKNEAILGNGVGLMMISLYTGYRLRSSYLR
eukprot:maker-scaffold_5-snap-gene-6.50-mRNA-1 protein AED:0.00 eAED:0.00 QI:59/1/1/1/1/1/2/132/593